MGCAKAGVEVVTDNTLTMMIQMILYIFGVPMSSVNAVGGKNVPTAHCHQLSHKIGGGENNSASPVRLEIKMTESIDTGAAFDKLERLIALSQK